LDELVVAKGSPVGALQLFASLFEVGVFLEVLAVQRRSVLQLVHVDVADLLEEVLLQFQLPSKVLRVILQLEEVEAVLRRGFV